MMMVQQGWMGPCPLKFQKPLYINVNLNPFLGMPPRIFLTMAPQRPYPGSAPAPDVTKACKS